MVVSDFQRYGRVFSIDGEGVARLLEVCSNLGGLRFTKNLPHHDNYRRYGSAAPCRDLAFVMLLKNKSNGNTNNRNLECFLIVFLNCNP